MTVFRVHEPDRALRQRRRRPRVVVRVEVAPQHHAIIGASEHDPRVRVVDRHRGGALQPVGAARMRDADILERATKREDAILRRDTSGEYEHGQRHGQHQRGATTAQKWTC